MAMAAIAAAAPVTGRARSAHCRGRGVVDRRRTYDRRALAIAGEAQR